MSIKCEPDARDYGVSVVDAENEPKPTFDKPEDEEIVTEFDVDDFHDFDHSIANILFENNDSKYQPIFNVINCETHAKKNGVRVEWRQRDDFMTYLSIIEALGGRTTMLSTAEALSKSIPILFESLSDKWNNEMVKKWKLNEVKRGRVPSDVFSEKFITDILMSGIVGDLNLYRTCETDFRPYDANAFLIGTHCWENLQKLV